MTDLTAKEFRRLKACARSAKRLCDWLGRNAGTTDDWPIDLVARDESSSNKLSDLLNDLEKKWRMALGVKLKRKKP